MPSAPPSGQPMPTDGALPASALSTLGDAPFGLYLHVPYCAHRCGYCDFNTYVDDSGATSRYADAAIAEVALAQRVLSVGSRAIPQVQTVFVGGGTPTLLPVADLARMLAAVDESLGIAEGAEVTIEANPETLSPAYLDALRAAGATRLSLGMQSATPHVLATLERLHTPGRVAECVAWARDAGFEQVSVDLIYGTPGETDEEWARTLDAAVAMAPDHVSAYALVAEAGTRLAATIDRGALAAVDDDVLATRYELADDVLTAAGLHWYEVSNWARDEAARCQHNVGYWAGGDWWGIGPGAHSHVGGVRWWNVRLPSEHAARLAAGASPAQAGEVLDDDARHVERVLLGVRLADGLPLSALRPAGRAAVAALVADGLLDGTAADGGAGRAVLTRRGRLLADAVVRALVD